MWRMRLHFTQSVSRGNRLVIGPGAGLTRGRSDVNSIALRPLQQFADVLGARRTIERSAAFSAPGPKRVAIVRELAQPLEGLALLVELPKHV